MYDKNKIKCELCYKSHSFFVSFNLCSKHTSCLSYKYDTYYDNDDYDPPEDYYDYESNNICFKEIATAISKMIKYSTLTYKVGKMKDDPYVNYFLSNHNQFIFVYQNKDILCKFIYNDYRLALIFNDKIYTTSSFSNIFKEMYFGELKYEILSINQILEKFRIHFKLEYTQIQNFDSYDKIENFYMKIFDLFNSIEKDSVYIELQDYKCIDCNDYYEEFRFIKNSDEIIKIRISNKTELIVYTPNKIYINTKNKCIHFNSINEDIYLYRKNRVISDFEIKVENNINYLNLNNDYIIEHKTFLEISKLIISYCNLSKEKEKRTWRDITICDNF